MGYGEFCCSVATANVIKGRLTIESDRLTIRLDGFWRLNTIVKICAQTPQTDRGKGVDFPAIFQLLSAASSSAFDH